jgi:carbohydrate-selective porin OprB
LEEFGWNHDEAAQVYSNIDAASRTTLYELWFEQKWMAGKVRIKSGKIDANSEFAVVESASDFLNSSMGFSPDNSGLSHVSSAAAGSDRFLEHTAKLRGWTGSV